MQLPLLFCQRLCSPLPVLPRSRPLRFTFGQAVRQAAGGNWDLPSACTCFEGAVSDTKFSLGHCRERDVPDYSRSQLVCKPVDQADGGAQLSLHSRWCRLACAVLCHSSNTGWVSLFAVKSLAPVANGMSFAGAFTNCFISSRPAVLGDLLQTQVVDTRRQNGLGAAIVERQIGRDRRNGSRRNAVLDYSTAIAFLRTLPHLCVASGHVLQSVLPLKAPQTFAILAAQEKRDTSLSSGLQPTPLFASINFLPVAQTTSSPSQARVRLPCTRRKDFTMHYSFGTTCLHRFSPKWKPFGRVHQHGDSRARLGKPELTLLQSHLTQVFLLIVVLLFVLETRCDRTRATTFGAANV